VISSGNARYNKKASRGEAFRRARTFALGVSGEKWERLPRPALRVLQRVLHCAISRNYREASPRVMALRPCLDCGDPHAVAAARSISESTSRDEARRRSEGTARSGRTRSEGESAAAVVLGAWLHQHGSNGRPHRPDEANEVDASRCSGLVSSSQRLEGVGGLPRDGQARSNDPALPRVPKV
jgi:hypothetical protein